MSLTSLLGIARSALMVHQRAMAVTGNNVANAQTPGYSRQRLELTQATPGWSPSGSMGRGVEANTISRARDVFFDAAYRRDSSLLNHASTSGDILGQLEAGLGEPGTAGLGASLDNLFTAFGDLANNPTSNTSRMLVSQAANRLTDRFHQADTNITQLISDGIGRLRQQTSEVNKLASQIADLNVQILSAGSGGSPALEDQRDLALDQLSGLLSINVIHNSNGTVDVQTGGSPLVNAGSSYDLTVRLSNTLGPGVGFAGNTARIDPGSGSMKALIDLTATKLPGYRTQLDKLAKSVVEQVNNIHKVGYTLAGATGIDFFDPNSTTAGSITLSDAIKASNDSIAAGDTPGGGDGGNAMRMGDLVQFPLLGLGNLSLRDYYVGFSSAVGAAVSDAQQQATIQDTLVNNDDAQRQQVSGVSVDEEMVNLISQQQAYGAAARLISIASQMSQELLNMI